MAPSDLRVALITGAAGGIGSAIAKEFLKDGWNVSLGSRDLKKLESIFGKEGGNKHYFRYEATDGTHEKPWVEAVTNKWKRIDAVILVAGGSQFVDYENFDQERIDNSFQLNLFSPWRIIGASLPLLKASGQGRVGIISSVAAQRKDNTSLDYFLTKGAQSALVRAMPGQFWGKGIRTIVLEPDWTSTKLIVNSKSRQVDLKDCIQPGDLASTMLHLVNKPNSFSVGTITVVCQQEKHAY